MTQVHTIARDSAPPWAASIHKPLHPKTMTVFLDAGPSGKKRAHHAVALAQRWDAHLVGVHIVFTSAALHPRDSYAIGEKAIQQVIAHEKEIRAGDQEVAFQIGDQFVDLCSRSDVSCEFRGISWRQPAEDAILNALHSDLVIVGHPQPNGLPGDMSLETIFLASGAPLVVLPNAWHGKAIGDKVLVAWNASREARRAVSDALSFLVAAKAVTILLVDPDKGHRHGEEPGADIALQLARHGARVDVDRVTSNGVSVAQVILGYARESRSDLLVFGAYSHARLKQRLLGGTTRTLLAQMPVPALVSR
jgi:nucleotide-binding universal stress UspA family protein